MVLLALLVARVDASPMSTALGTGTSPDGEAEPSPDGLGGVAPGATEELDVTYSHGPPEALVDPEVVAAVARTAPSVRSAIAAAYRVAGLADDPAPGFARRARLAALVPWVGGEVGQDDTWSDVVDPTVGHLFVYNVRATWHLDRLVFDANEMRASAMEIARRRDRRRLALLVSRTYYTWLRSRAASARAASWAVRADQAAAELDALTDGAWMPR